MKKSKILIVDDHALMRIGLKTLLSGQPDLIFVGEASSGEEAISLTRKLHPDLIVMDLMLTGMSGAAATKIIHEENQDVRILILTSFGTAMDLSLAIVNGASGVLLKDSPSEAILTTIRRVAAGEKVIPDTYLSAAVADTTPLPLSARHREILQLVVKGLSNPEIADHFGLSRITVKKHVQAIFSRLGASSRAEAVAIAISKQLVKM